MKRNTNNNVENKPIKAPSDSIIYNGEIANNANKNIRDITAANLARKTRVEYAILDLKDLSTTTGEMVVEYTRSTDKAEKLVANALQKSGANLTTTRVVVTGIFNDSAERRIYNTADILQYANAVFTDEESARQYAQTLENVNWSIRKVENYVYSALAWTREDVTETDDVESFVWDDTERYSGLRSYTGVINSILKARYQSAAKNNPNAHQKRVIFVDPESRVRVERPKYAVITAGKLAQCGYKVVGEKNTDIESETSKE